ncbi:MAG: InlB B-repeat-containing protein, partial [Alphaproteobacteria bacterium]|nr:InlB B-repeat-containing protein [Alphaproteobacteria bacterium]
ANKEAGYEVAFSEEVINNQKYKTAFLAITSTVTFKPNGGSVSEATRNIANGHKIGTLPIPTRAGYEYVGWFTAATGGTQIDENTIINNDITYYAHWTEADYAMIGNTKYGSLQEAINAVSNNNVETTIKLLRNTAENVTVSQNKNIKFDFQTYTLSNSKSAAVIENSGTIKIINGSITSNASTGTINNNAGGVIIVSGGSIIATGTRQAIYNNSGGTVEITGDAYLSSTATGKPTGSNMERATVQNLSGGTLIITGGTLVGINQQAISNEGTLTIGTNNGSINIQTPAIRGETYGLKNAGTFNFYDGIIKGITNAISGTITNQETNSHIVNGTETISGKTYKTQHLEISS